ncbi:hypothetical protein ACHAXR_003500 [Thalassiosira sp. AJA248-18]
MTSQKYPIPTLLFLLVVAAPHHVLAAGRTRQHVNTESSSAFLRGTVVNGGGGESGSLPQPTQLSPTPKPTLHPTTRGWAGFEETDYPTAFPTVLPTQHDYHTSVPTPSDSSYIPTSEVPTSLDHLSRNIQSSDGGDVGVDISSGDETSIATAAAATTTTNRCPPGQQFFQLDLRTDDYSCESSWILERLVTDDVGGRTIRVDEHDGYYYHTQYEGAGARCLDEGWYRFTIYDAFGDGLQSPGYYVLAIDGTILAGSSNFGWEETTTFVVGNSASAATTAISGQESEVLETSNIVIDDTLEEIDGKRRPTDIEGPSVSFSNPDMERPSLVTTTTNAPVSAPTSKPNDSANHYNEPSQKKWTELLSDDFENDYGIFHAGSDDYATYYPFVKDRRGVLRIQHGNAMSSSVYSDNIAFDHTSSNSNNNNEIMVIFSYYANSMEGNDGFCLDYSLDDGDSWHSQKCWHAVGDFTNGMWYDDTSVVVELKNRNNIAVYENVDSFRIRFRCKADSAQDDVLIDKVQVMGLVGAERGDSI